MTDRIELRWLAYSRTATLPFDDDMLADLLAHSRAANAPREITGMLLYRAGRFIQFLEGPEAALRDTMQRIARDPRHANVRVLLDTPTTERRFTEWTMGYQPVIETGQPAPAGFRDTFYDIENSDNEETVLLAARELTTWFRTRSLQGMTEPRRYPTRRP